MELRKTGSNLRRVTVSGIVYHEDRHGKLDTSTQEFGDIEMVGSNDGHFSAAGAMEREIARIRRFDEDGRLTVPYREDVASLGLRPEIRLQKERAIHLGLAVLLTGNWETIETWPLRVKTPEAD